MISEKYFIENYRNFWEEIFPGITNYMRRINKLNDIDCVIEDLGPIKAEQKRPELVGFVNDIAFYIFEKVYNDKNYFLSSTEIIKAFEFIKSLNKNKYFFDVLKSNEYILEEFKTIEQIKQKLADRYNSKKPKIHPEFFGCGFLNQVYGDLLYSNTLVEIKARSEKSDKGRSAGFRSDDLIQLFIYGALYYSERREEKTTRYGQIEEFELFNPRLGYCWRENIETISENISGGSSIDLFDEIVRFLSYTNTSL